MLASLRHPCVVAFYGVVSAHVPLTVTEFMCDGSLRGALLRLQQEEQFVVRVRLPSTVYCERERERESGPGGLTREVETPLPSSHPRCGQVMPLQLYSIPNQGWVECRDRGETSATRWHASRSRLLAEWNTSTDRTSFTST